MSERKRRRAQNIIIRRESVAAADDVFAPHEKKIRVGDESLSQVIESVIGWYLPKIQGGKATWIAMGKEPLAVVAQQWKKPYYLVDSVAKLRDMVDLTSGHQIEFLYWSQVEPKDVVECIKRGKPWPDRYEGDK